MKQCVPVLVKMGGEKVVYQSVSVKEKICEETIPEIVPAPPGFGTRHVQTLILFICVTVLFSMRAQLSVSMVAMTSPQSKPDLCPLNGTNIDVNSTVTKLGTNDINNTEVAIKPVHNCTAEPESLSKWNVYRTYDWHKSTQEMILFAFFVGYTTMMLPMGIVAQKYGGKKPILVALFINGIISILTPWVPIFAGWLGACLCRLLQGMTQAALYPSIHTMLGKWAPLCERGRLSTYVYTGSQFGTIFIFQIAGFFAGSPSLGWPAIFWLCGALSLVCAGLFMWLGAATPHDHPTITVEELMYIAGDGAADDGTKARKTPWKAILTSSAVWGLVASHAGSAAGYLLILTQTPTYMSKVLGVDIKHNGLYSSLPYISMYFLALGFGYVSDMLVRKKVMSIANIRRSANTIGMLVSGVFLLAFGFVQNTVLAIVLLILCLGSHSGVHVGYHINQIDLAPNFAGPIMALGNMLANLTSLLVPVMVSNVVQDDLTNQHRWQIVFMIIAGFQLLTNTVFVIFVKGTVQPWNFYGSEDNEDGQEMHENAKFTENGLRGSKKPIHNNATKS